MNDSDQHGGQRDGRAAAERRRAGPQRAGCACARCSHSLPYVLRYRGKVAAALVSCWLRPRTLAVPLAVRRMIDFGFSGRSPDRPAISRCWSRSPAVLALARASRYYLVTTLGERVVADLRAAVFAHVTELSPAFFDTAQSGEIVSRLAADTTQIKSAVGATVSLALRNLVMFLGAVAMMAVTSPRLSVLVIVAIPIIVLPLVAFGRSVRRRSRAGAGRARRCLRLRERN